VYSVHHDTKALMECPSKFNVAGPEDQVILRGKGALTTKQGCIVYMPSLGIKLYPTDTNLLSLNETQAEPAIIISADDLKRTLPTDVKVKVDMLPIYDHEKHPDAVYTPDLRHWWEHPLNQFYIGSLLTGCMVLCLLFSCRNSIGPALTKCFQFPLRWKRERASTNQDLTTTTYHQGNGIAHFEEGIPMVPVPIPADRGRPTTIEAAAEVHEQPHPGHRNGSGRRSRGRRSES